MRAAVLLLLLPFALGAAPATAAEPPLLVGTVGLGFTIGLADANGKHVDVLGPGSYRLLVHDLSDQHNFVLGSKTTGARPAATEVPFVGDQAFTIDLHVGEYAYACSPHFEIMNGNFSVKAPPLVLTLNASVSSRGVSLSAKNVAEATYKLRVSDRSRTRTSHVVGPGLNRRTGKAFTAR